MTRFVIILPLLVSLQVKAQDIDVFNRIDSVVTQVDLIASKGLLDTLRSGLLNEGGTTSDIFFLRKDHLVQKISIVSQSKNYEERIILLDGRPVFAQFLRPDGSKRTYYLVDESAYLKEGQKFNKGNGSYWFSIVDAYLSLLKDQLENKVK